MSREPDHSRAVRDGFRALFAADRARGQAHDLAHYQALFPGFAAIVAAEFARLAEGERAEPAAAPPTPSTPPPPPGAPAEAHPSHVGAYRILGVLGEGGMGTVYLAEQKEPVRRRVALKVIKLGMDSRQVLARFEAERQALAMMNHDNIARVFEAGTTERGQPFFVMEHVEGIPIHQYSDQHKLTIPQRIELFQQVCAGVQHAHQKGVIHRDLKPGNVLVTRREERAIPKIIDFGLARATDHQLIEQTLFTEQGQILGTPEYMSPEQAGFDAQGIDTRTDIYSLGVMLYELLAGELPFSPQELRKAGLLEIQRRIREDQPPKPSTRIATGGAMAGDCAERRQTSLHALTRQLRGDLDWIVLKAMAKEPERRYESATGLAMDLGRFLGCQPVLAGPPSAAYRLRKFVQRYRGQVVAGALVFTTLVAGAIGTVTFAFSAQQQAEVARQKGQEARAAAEVAQQRGREAEAARVAAAAAAAAAEAGKQAAQRAQSLYLADLAIEQIEAGDAMTAILLALAALPRRMDAPDRPFVPQAESALYRALLSNRETVLVRHGSRIGSAAFLPDGDGFLTSDNFALRQEQMGLEGDRDTTWLWDLGGRSVAALGGGFAGLVPGSSRVATTTGERGEDVTLWDPTGAERAVLHGLASDAAVYFSPDGRRILRGGNSAVRLWDAAGRLERIFGFRPQAWVAGTWPWMQTATAHRLAFATAALSPSGRHILAMSEASVRVWEVDGDEIAVLGEPGQFRSADFDPTGRRVLTVAANQSAVLWDVHGRQVAAIADCNGGSWSRDGRRLVTLTPGGGADLRDADGVPIARLAHGSAINSVAFSANGRRIATTSDDGSAHLWNARGRQTAALIGHQAPVRSAAFSPDGRQVLTASDDGTARLWDVTGRQLAVLGGHAGPVRASFSPDGRRVLTAGTSTAKIWDVDLPAVTVVDEPGAVFHAVFSPDGKTIRTVARRDDLRAAVVAPWKAALEREGGGRVPDQFRELLSTRIRMAEWDAAGNEVGTGAGRELAIPYGLDRPGGHRTWSAQSGLMLSRDYIAVSADGRRIMTSSGGGRARLWDAAGGPARLLGSLEGAFSPDGRMVVCPGSGGAARLLDVDGNEIAVLRGHEGGVSYAAFSPDGSRVVTTSGDMTVRIWDTAGNQLAILRGHDKHVTHAVFSGDGQRIVTAALDGDVRLWRVEGDPLAVMPAAGVLGADISPDGRRVVTASWDKTARLWDSDGNELAVLRHEGQVWTARFSPDGRHILTAADDGTARLWFADGTSMAVFGDGTPSSAQAAFRPDGRSILVVSGETARLYPLYPTQELIDRARALAHRGLTPAQRERFHLGADAEAQADGPAADQAPPTPPELDPAAVRRRAEFAVECLSRYEPLVENVVARLRSADLREDVREIALRLALERRDDAKALLDWAWRVVDPDAAARVEPPAAWQNDPPTRVLALRYAQAAVELAERDPAGHAALVWALFANGAGEEALQAAARAVDLVAEEEKDAARARRERLRAVVASEQALAAYLDRRTSAAQLLQVLERPAGLGGNQLAWLRRRVAMRINSLVRQVADTGAVTAHDRSLEFARLTVELSPDHANFHRILAWALRAQGLEDEAEAAARRAGELAPLAAGWEGRVFGFTSSPPDPELAGDLGLDPARSLVVRAVTAGSMAEFVGLRAGDVLTQVAGAPATRANLEQAKRPRRFFQTVPFEVRRGAATLLLDVPLGASEPR